MLKINRPRVAKGDIRARVVCRIKQNPRKVIAFRQERTPLAISRQRIGAQKFVQSLKVDLTSAMQSEPSVTTGLYTKRENSRTKRGIGSSDSMEMLSLAQCCRARRVLWLYPLIVFKSMLLFICLNI